MAVDDDSLSIRVGARADLPPAAARVEIFCLARGIPHRTAHRFNLALEEALANVISHAFPDGRRHEIAVRVALRDGDLTATVCDDGRPFDSLGEPPPDLHAPVESRKVGGLGIHLLRSLTDAVEYRRADGRNHLTLRTHVGVADLERAR